MNSFKKVLSKTAFAVLIIAASYNTALAQNEINPYLNLNPYSELYLACEELADENAPIGLGTEHEAWKELFEACVMATLDIEPAAGGDELTSEQMESLNNQPQDLIIKDVKRDNLIKDDYGQYQNDMLDKDSPAVN